MKTPGAKKKRHAKRLPYTPNGRIQQALRALWLHSRERNAAVKRENNTCERCHTKGSVAKGKEVSIEVHHRKGILNWAEIYKVVRQFLLTDPSHLEVLCKPCHAKETDDPRPALPAIRVKSVLD